MEKYKGLKVLFFDTETNGLPKNYKAPVTEIENWPRVIQLAFSVYLVNEQGKPQFIEEFKELIKPDGWEIPKEKFWIDNGYSNETNTAIGHPIKDALEYFLEWSDECHVLVAHNMAFDSKIIGAELIRLGMKGKKVLPKICTMVASTNFCAIPHANGMGFKWPKLEELHLKLFGEKFEGAHDAGNDVSAMADCFWKLLELEIIKI